jgi:hypothetical protein
MGFTFGELPLVGSSSLVVVILQVGAGLKPEVYFRFAGFKNQGNVVSF